MNSDKVSYGPIFYFCDDELVVSTMKKNERENGKKEKEGDESTKNQIADNPKTRDSNSHSDMDLDSLKEHSQPLRSSTVLCSTEKPKTPSGGGSLISSLTKVVWMGSSIHNSSITSTNGVENTDQVRPNQHMGRPTTQNSLSPVASLMEMSRLSFDVETVRSMMKERPHHKIFLPLIKNHTNQPNLASSNGSLLQIPHTIVNFHHSSRGLSFFMQFHSHRSLRCS